MQMTIWLTVSNELRIKANRTRCSRTHGKHDHVQANIVAKIIEEKSR